QFEHLLEAIHYVLQRFAWPVSAQEINHDVTRLNSSVEHDVDAAQKYFLILAIVPSSVDALGFELVIAIFNFRQNLCTFLVNQANIDSLATHPPIRLSKKIIIQKNNLFRVAFAAPD